MNNKGFTMVEMIVSIVILAVAVLALTSTTASLTGISATAEKRALALQACEDRMARIRLHPIYQQLDSIFTESNTAVPGLQGFTRATDITRVLQTGDRQGKYVDYTRVTVTVNGPGLDEPISRTVTIGVS